MSGLLRGMSIIALWTWLSVGASASEDWLRFRGPNGAGVVAQSQPAPIKWSDTENLKWKVDLPGPGSSSPIVIGQRVIVTCWSGYGLDRESPGEQSDLRRHLVCVDRQTGQIKWDKSVAPYLPEDRFGGMFAEHGYASHTPASDGEHIFAFFGKTGVVAFDLEGNQLWQQSVGVESGANDWGTASSPILYENLVIVPATAESEALVALDKKTGNEVWRQEASGFHAVWGSPVLVPVDGNRTDLVMAVPNEIWGFDPATGKLVWYCKSMSTNSFCSSVCADAGVVYAVESGPGGGGGIAVRAGGQGDVTETHIVWSGRQQNRIVTPLMHAGRIYMFGNRMATCLDAATGKQIYRVRLRGGSDRAMGRGGRGQDYASPVMGGEIIYFPSRSGDIYVLKAADEFLQLAVNRVTSEEEDFSATPAICDGQLFLRSSKRLYCVEDMQGTSTDLAAAVAAARDAASKAPADTEAADDGPGGGGRRRGQFDPAAFFRREDANGDGKLTGDEINDRLRDGLAQIDRDGDGAVTEAEFVDGMRRMFRSQRGRRGGGEESNKPDRPQRPPVTN